MIQLKESNKYTEKKPTVITIGTFDGVHIGHQKIIEQLVSTARLEDLQSCVLTFFPHPRMVLQKDANIKLINTINERKQLLEKAGVDLFFVKKFSKEFSRLDAEEFVKSLLVKTLNAKKVIIGYDHRFGRNRSADINSLREFGEKYGFSVEEIPMQDVEDVAVSSTKIRNALNAGDIETANSFLGYPFMLTGKVIKGKQLGAKLGFPTANLFIEEPYKLIPKYGAYVVKSKIDDETVYGMMNIGLNPTVKGDEESVEIHFFNFNKNIYNQKLQIDILYRLRDEKQFDSVEDLKTQLQIDKKRSQEFIKNHYA